MGDPLSVLREFVSSGRKWKEEGDEVVFGDMRFKKEEETAWRPANRQGTCRQLRAELLQTEGLQPIFLLSFLLLFNLCRRGILVCLLVSTPPSLLFSLPPSLVSPYSTGYYKLSELVILVEHAHMPYQQYLRTMGGVLKQQSFVSKLDFDNLLKYLRGETATSKQVGGVDTEKKQGSGAFF